MTFSELILGNVRTLAKIPLVQRELGFRDVVEIIFTIFPSRAGIRSGASPCFPWLHRVASVLTSHMTVEFKPLFHPEVIRQHLRHFVLQVSMANSWPRLKPYTALEGNRTRDSLEIPFGGWKMSAVNQCYRYAIRLPCKILLTSMQEKRFYHKGSNQQTCEHFETVRLATGAGLPISES